jgi:molybdopterin converting factor small subunit
MDLLVKSAAKPVQLNFSDIIIAVNGVDSTVLGGREAAVKEGDEITVVSIVHGGNGIQDDVQFCSKPTEY